MLQTVAKRRDGPGREKDDFYFLSVFLASRLLSAFALCTSYSHHFSITARSVNGGMLWLILLAAVLVARGAKYSQAFDAATVANGTAMTTLSDGARVDGSAVVANAELGVMSQHGRFFVPTLANSSLGWTASFSLRLTSSSTGADGVALVWGNTDSVVDAVVLHGSTAGNIGGNASYVFMAWLVDTFGTLGGADSPGFFVVNSTGVRTASASRAVTTLPASGTVSATVFVAWNPLRGATFQTTGFGTNANFVDIPFVHSGSDAHSWMFIGDTGSIAELAAIDNVVIDAPCGECRSAGNACLWNLGGQFECAAPTTTPPPTPAPAPNSCMWSSWSACPVPCGGVIRSRARVYPDDRVRGVQRAVLPNKLRGHRLVGMERVFRAMRHWHAVAFSIHCSSHVRRVVLGDNHERIVGVQRFMYTSADNEPADNEPAYTSVHACADSRASTQYV
jgi:hypothetical protein